MDSGECEMCEIKSDPEITLPDISHKKLQSDGSISSVNCNYSVNVNKCFVFLKYQLFDRKNGNKNEEQSSQTISH